MTATPTRAQRFAAIVAPAAQRAGYTGHGSNARLARDTGMSESSVSRMLKGQAIPDLKFFAPVAVTLGVSLLDLLAELGVPPESIQPLSETKQSQVGSRSISPVEAADRLGLKDPVGREMLIATIERLKRLENESEDQPGDERGGTAAQM
ncbi:multiprotein-bridging factor 1 family protein [Streptomyces sp. NPDC102437]|uniref:helix-turn-helix domain-containing protein n=1 Tax=Streptomyces sp. NPDC102437 TaxID=3366175 RepID=UPI0037FB827D